MASCVQVTVDRPDVQGRIAILKVHSRGKTLGSDVDFEKVARRTPGTHLTALQISIILYILNICTNIMGSIAVCMSAVQISEALKLMPRVIELNVTKHIEMY